MAHTDEEILQAAWEMGMRLRNSIISWLHHPSYHSKKDLASEASEVVGAYELVRSLGIPLTWEERACMLDLANFLNTKPGQDRLYRIKAQDLAVTAFPFKEN